MNAVFSSLSFGKNCNPELDQHEREREAAKETHGDADREVVALVPDDLSGNAVRRSTEEEDLAALGILHLDGNRRLLLHSRVNQRPGKHELRKG